MSQLPSHPIPIHWSNMYVKLYASVASWQDFLLPCLLCRVRELAHATSACWRSQLSSAQR